MSSVVRRTSLLGVQDGRGIGEKCTSQTDVGKQAFRRPPLQSEKRKSEGVSSQGLPDWV
jgi:hypothetical protein